MYTEQRVILNTTDISKEVNDFRAGSAAFEPTAGQYLYIGSIMPFNNIWFETASPTATSAVVSVDVWNGASWKPAVDIIDETNGMAQTGRIQWSVAVDNAWILQYKSQDVAGLSAQNIYNMFWLRMAWDADMDTGTTLEYVGQKFSTDAILYSFYPDLNNSSLKDAFLTGKTTWDEQHYMAAEHIVRDLKKGDIIRARSQLLDHSLFADASCHKVAEIIYTAFGTPYFDQKEAANKAYLSALNVKYANIDQNQDGRLDPVERTFGTNWMTR